MINFLSSWVEQIAIALIIASIFEMIIPNGSIKRYVKVVLSIYIIFNIISPFINSNDLYNLSTSKVDAYIENATSTNEVDQTSMNGRLEELYITEIKKDITSKVEELGYYTHKCDIDITLGDNEKESKINKIILKISQNKVSINEVNTINIKNENNIKNIQDYNDDNEVSKLKNDLSEYYKIDENIIEIIKK